MDEREQLEQAIAVQESLRGKIDDAIIEATIKTLREKIATLKLDPQPQQQRKQVTVLFADVFGFTAMSETMDAEDVQETMNALWQQVDNVILERNGRIDKHIGDAVMALWGTDEAREDDPEQAIVMQDYLDKNSDLTRQEIYLNQPHHRVIWAAWQEKQSSD